MRKKTLLIPSYFQAKEIEMDGALGSRNSERVPTSNKKLQVRKGYGLDMRCLPKAPANAGTFRGKMIGL